MPVKCSEFLSWASVFLFLLISLNGVIRPVHGHGRLVEPPSRSSAWRYGFPTEKDYNDAEAYCGGWSRQHTQNGGKCGVCGDAWDLPQPRAHENGGRYGQGVIVRTYKMNSDVEIGVELTANHQGYFEFRLCPQNFVKGPETDECFDQHILRRTDVTAANTEGHKYYPGPGSNVIFRSNYKLPEGLTCTQCVLQWRYVAGNNWGNCPNGTGMVGCGPQEQFRGCADVAINVDGVPDPSTIVNITTTTAKPRTRGTVTSRYTRPSTTTIPTESTLPTTNSSISSSTSSTTTQSSEAVPANPFGDGSNPGPYAGIIIALASLLFAIICLCVTVFYFYYCHQTVKKFASDQWRKIIARRRVADSSQRMNTKPPLKLPASVFSNHHPHLVMVGAVNPGVFNEDGSGKPPVPPRLPMQQRQVNRPTATNLRQLSLVISEPLDVTINGISVPRDGSSTTSSLASSSGPNSPNDMEANVSNA